MPNDVFVVPQSNLFNTLTRDATLTERVTGEIRNYFIAGQLAPGDRLPAERDLARQFGVSRTVVREAVRSLAAQGVLDIRAGRGILVRNPSSESIAQSMALYLRVGRQDFDYRAILEVRRLLEIEIAGLAAERRTAEDLEALRAVLDETAKVGANFEAWLKDDIAFHALLAQATKNALFSLLLDSIVDIMISVRRLAFGVEDAAARTLKYHSAIFEEVERGDIAGARRAMAAHLAEAEATMRQGLALEMAKSQEST